MTISLEGMKRDWMKATSQGAAVAMFSVVLAAAVCCASQNGLAQNRDDAFRGKTVSMIIGAGTGGGIDLYGRVVARHIGKHLPGQPTVVPQNMPAAGSIAAANHLYNIAPKDGTAIGIISQGLILDEVLGTPGLRFELAKFNWVGRISSDVLVTFMWNTAKVKTIADAMNYETSLGATGAGSSVTKKSYALQPRPRYKIQDGPRIYRYGNQHARHGTR